MKQLFKNYKKPTPRKWRMIGDMLMIISTSFAGYEFMMNQKEWGLFFLVLGTIGKVLTNFSWEDEPDKKV